MTEAHQKAINIIMTEKKKNSPLYEFFQALLYGTVKQGTRSKQRLMHYNFYTKRVSQCVLYLHQNHIGILVCVDKLMTGVRSYFNIKNLDIAQFNSSYELDQNLEKHKYLILKQKQDQIILIFENVQDKDDLVINLKSLKKSFEKIPDLYDPMILKSFIRADTNQNGQISWNQLKNLIRIMKIDLDQDKKNFIKKILGMEKDSKMKKPEDLKKSNRNLTHEKVQSIEFSQFERLWKIFYCRNELTNVFQKYNNEEFHTWDDYLTPKLDSKEFQRFLIEEQKESEQDAKKIIKQIYERQSFSLSFYDFCHYLFSPYNNLLNDDYKNKKTETHKPLNHYYCYSSHNTYLTGDQIFSDSRVERYLVDLENGLRCVEIDAHDSSQGPIVKHGYTPTSSVLFKDVIESVKRFTDRNKEHTPIILSIENHCNQENQIKMVNILKENFDEKNKILLVGQAKKFPSFSDCIGKIILKGPGTYKLFQQNKSLKNSDIDNTMLRGQYQEDEEGEQNINEKDKHDLEEKTSLSQNYNNLKKNFIGVLEKLQEDRKEYVNKKNEFMKLKKEPTKMQQNLLKKQEKQMKNSKKYHEKYHVSSELLSIISMLSKGKLSYDATQKAIDWLHWECTSFSENKLLKFYSNPEELQKIRHLSMKKWFRSYPDGLRILSSNYDPIPSLQMGVQIIAINTQSKNDVNCHILKAFFMKGINKTSGYRSKSIVQKLSSEVTARNKWIHDKLALNEENNRYKKTFVLTKIQLKFISGLRIYQNDDTQKSIPPVFVKAYFTGTKRDNGMNEKLLTPKTYTEVVYNESFNPKFNNSDIVEIKSIDTELGFLIVEIPQCGRSVLPLDCMKPGWRVISLYDEELKQKESRLLCFIEINKNNVDMQANTKI